MAYPFPSDAWVQALKEAINTSQAYREAAKTWEGDFFFVIEPDDTTTLDKPVTLYMDLWHGECRDAYVVADPASHRQPEFVISAPYAVWRQVVTGELDPIKAMMTRQLKLQGNLMKIMRSVKAAHELVRCCTMVPTEFPDQPTTS